MNNTNTLKELDGKELYLWFQSGSDEVRRYKKHLNSINVFPVADGDTGTNLSTTMTAMVELSQKEYDFSKMLRNLSESALANARGNSGILFASYINGLSLSCENRQVVSIVDFSRMANDALVHLYEAVNHPLEGTIISVIRDWASYLLAHGPNSNDFRELLISAYEQALVSLEATKNQLSILKKNHVVDSGAKGFVTFLNGINHYLKGESQETIQNEFEADLSIEYNFETEDTVGDFAFCTEAYLLVEDPSTLPGIAPILKKKLEPLGDSLIVSVLQSKIRIHIHTNQPDQVMSILRPYGVILEQKADNMVLQNLVKHHQKHRIGIVTDSIADLPSEYKTQQQIHTLPIGLYYKDTTYLDKITITNQSLAPMIREKNNYPTSSQPTPAKISAMLEQLLDTYDSLILLCVSDKMSGTYESLKGAIAPYVNSGRKITLLNTLTNSGAQGLLVRQAAELLDQGATHEELVAALHKAIPHTKILVCLRTLEYAVKSGRVPDSIGRLGMFLGLRPIMTIDKDGKGTSFGIGFSQTSITRQIIKELKKKKSSITSYCIVHASNPELAKEYQDIFTTLLGKEPVYVTEISSVVAIHSGLGSVAVCFTESAE